MNIIEAMTDPRLFGNEFGGSTWAGWRALLAAFHGLPLDKAMLDHYRAVTGREKAPEGPHSELWLAVGRRGGKTRIAALIGIYESFFKDHRPRLAPGEVATTSIIAKDRRQARTCFRYVQGFIRQAPMLEQMVVKESAESIELNNQTVLEVGTATHRGSRGYTYGCVVLDEIAHWHSEGANPDKEIVQAVRPGLSTLGGPLLALSSPYARKGALWNAHKRHYGKDGSPVLVAQAPSRLMNPGLSQRIIDEAAADDAASAAAEYGAQFRNDIEAFIDIVQVARLCRSEPLELPPERFNYLAFVDPSGGGADGFALCIGHREKERIIVDVLRERNRTAPAQVVAEYADILKKYGVRQVTGDRYAGAWPEQEFARHGVRYIHSDKNRTELYTEALSSINNGRVELPPMDKLLHQFGGLERKTTSSGRDIIDHPVGMHDDLANATAGLITLAGYRSGGLVRVPLGGI